MLRTVGFPVQSEGANGEPDIKRMPRILVATFDDAKTDYSGVKKDPARAETIRAWTFPEALSNQVPAEAEFIGNSIWPENGYATEATIGDSLVHYIPGPPGTQRTLSFNQQAAYHKPGVLERLQSGGKPDSMNERCVGFYYLPPKKAAAPAESEDAPAVAV